MFIHVYVYVSIVYMLCSPMLEEIKNLSIYVHVYILVMMYFGPEACITKYKFVVVTIHSFFHKSNMFKGHMRIQTYSYLRYVLQFSKVLNVCRYKSYI